MSNEEFLWGTIPGKEKTEVKAIEDDLLNPDEVSAKLIQLEDRSQRNNLPIDGIKEEPNETWEACEKKSRISLRISWEYRVT